MSFLSSRNMRALMRETTVYHEWFPWKLSKDVILPRRYPDFLIKSHRRSQGNRNCSLVHLPIARIIRSDTGSARKLRILTYDTIKATLKKNGHFTVLVIGTRNQSVIILKRILIKTWSTVTTCNRRLLSGIPGHLSYITRITYVYDSECRKIEVTVQSKFA